MDTIAVKQEPFTDNTSHMDICGSGPTGSSGNGHLTTASVDDSCEVYILEQSNLHRSITSPMIVIKPEIAPIVIKPEPCLDGTAALIPSSHQLESNTEEKHDYFHVHHPTNSHMFAPIEIKPEPCLDNPTPVILSHQSPELNAISQIDEKFDCSEDEDQKHCPVDTNEAKYGFSIHDESILNTEEKSYTCFICSASFSNESIYYGHLQTHTGEVLETSYKCSECLSTFKTKRHYTQHLLIHTGERPYKCSECSSAYRNPSTLKVHMKTHSDERPFKCSECSSSFRILSHLKAHMRIHTGERPYKCSECPESFRSSSHLKAHMRTHTEESPYKCTECSSSFRVKSNLYKHMQAHTGE